MTLTCDQSQVTSPLTVPLGEVAAAHGYDYATLRILRRLLARRAA